MVVLETAARRARAPGAGKRCGQGDEQAGRIGRLEDDRSPGEQRRGQLMRMRLSRAGLEGEKKKVNEAVFAGSTSYRRVDGGDCLSRMRIIRGEMVLECGGVVWAGD